jgi:hypothetical protein
MMDFQVDWQLGRGNGHGTDNEYRGNTISFEFVFNVLMNALTGTLPNRSETYVIHKGDKVENGTIHSRVAANDLSKVVDYTEADLLNSPTGPANCPGNQFGPTFAEVEHTEEGPKNNPGPTNCQGPENSPWTYK